MQGPLLGALGLVTGPAAALTQWVATVGPSTVFYHRMPLYAWLADLSLHGDALVGSNRVSRMLLCVLLSYPLGALTPNLPHALLRHLYCLVLGVLSVQCVFGAGWLHLLLPSAAVYLVTWFCRATGALPGQGHWVAALVSFSYLIYRHLSRDAAASNGIDDSTLTMVLVVKLYTLCYNLYDAEHPQGTPGLSQSIVEARARRAVKALPNPLEYFAYVFNFGTVFAGPAFEFGEYKAAQEQSNAAPLLGRFAPGLWKLLQGVVWFGLTAVVNQAFPTSDLFMHSHASQMPSTLHFSATVLATLIFSRYQYYAIWKLSEGAAVLAGFGYRAPIAKFTRERKVNPAVEDFEAFTGVQLRAYLKTLSSAVDIFGVGILGAADWEGASNVRNGSIWSSLFVFFSP